MEVKSLDFGLDFDTVPLGYEFIEKFIIGDTFKLNAKVTPEKADQAIIWSSSDETIATVNQQGEVTTHVDGTAVITATAAGNDEVFEEFEFEVVNQLKLKVILRLQLMLNLLLKQKLMIKLI